jgi:hypothetical protein
MMLNELWCIFEHATIDIQPVYKRCSRASDTEFHLGDINPSTTGDSASGGDSACAAAVVSAAAIVMIIILAFLHQCLHSI